MKSVAIIGAGPMGLICAYRLLQSGYKVAVYERDDRLGGMSASFDFDGLRIERYYHFICKSDATLLASMQEFGLQDKLHWRNTKMGFYHEGLLHRWGSPLDLLRFKKLTLFMKLRYAANILVVKNIRDWRKLDKKNAETWLKKWLGPHAYQLLWGSLLTYKFYDLRHNLSAAWIAARIRRVAQSRDSLFSECLGYIEGGSESFVNKLAEEVIRLGGTITLKAEVSTVTTANSRVEGVVVNGAAIAYDKVISTIPLPLVPPLIPGLSPAIVQKIKSIENIGVVCVILKLTRAFTDNFWMNVNDSRMEISGMIEYSNLNPLPEHVLYIPYYLPRTHPKFAYTDAEFLTEVKACLIQINPGFNESWVKAASVSRYGFAQPVCTPGFFEKLPSAVTNIEGLLIADTTYYYPEDRSMSESLKLGNTLAELARKQ